MRHTPERVAANLRHTPERVAANLRHTPERVAANLRHTPERSRNPNKPGMADTGSGCTPFLRLHLSPFPSCPFSS
ncbi:hypothetical protein [Trichocoleus sp. DQ-U1]|uniref:hypothetical protein n=1 Tax=Trichocoleus sp. DQ-U1 TaxID=2933926 RepID=UPI0032987ED6